MRHIFAIEDELHDEPQGDFPTLSEALVELERRAELRWDEVPNLAPCTNHLHCGRCYEVVEYDATQRPRKELRRVSVLETSASGVCWIARDGGRLR